MEQIHQENLILKDRRYLSLDRKSVRYLHKNFEGKEHQTVKGGEGKCEKEITFPLTLLILSFLKGCLATFGLLGFSVARRILCFTALVRGKLTMR